MKDRYGAFLPERLQATYQQALKNIEQELTTMDHELYSQVYNRLEAISTEATELYNLVHEKAPAGSERQRVEGVLLHLLKTSETGKKQWFAMVDPRLAHELEAAL